VVPHNLVDTFKRNIAPLCFCSMTNTIAVIGTGAVGGWYGMKLHEAGNKVLFHMRGKNFQAGKQRGLTLRSVTGNIQIPPNELYAYQSTHEMAEAVGKTGFDWVVVALKSTAMDEIPDLIGPLLTKTTRLLFLMNGLVEDALTQRLRQKGCRYHSLYGGMAFVCVERTAPAEIEHKQYGSITVAVAESMGHDDDHEAILNKLFKGTNVTLCYEPSLLRGRWKKMMVNVSVRRWTLTHCPLAHLLLLKCLQFNGLCVAMGGVTVDKIAADPYLRSLASTIMDEASAIGNAELLEKYGAGNFKPLGVAERTEMMDWCDGVGEFAPSTLSDFLNGREMEIRYLFQEPIIRSKRLHIPCPVLEFVVSQIVARAANGIQLSNSISTKEVDLNRTPLGTLCQNTRTSSLLYKL
jgi:2-dehydropantoate 2-reductase